jgi:hypothetical protein
MMIIHWGGGREGKAVDLINIIIDDWEETARAVVGGGFGVHFSLEVAAGDEQKQRPRALPQQEPPAGRGSLAQVSLGKD